MICFASVLVAVCAWAIFDSSDALEMPLVRPLDVTLLICCTQVPIALQTPLA